MGYELNNSNGTKEAIASNGWHVVDFRGLKNPPRWFAACIYALGAIIGVGALSAGIAAFLLFGYDMLVGESKDRLEAAKVFFPVLVAIIGGPVLIWRALTAHWAAQAARKQADTDRDGFYTDVFTKAVEQLGATREVIETIEIGSEDEGQKRETITKTEPNLEVRLGAIYALERIAQDSERDHWPIMEVLCAYVRNSQNNSAPVGKPDDVDAFGRTSSWRKSIPELRPDIQAVLSVIGRRPVHRIEYEKKFGRRLNFSGANLQRAVLDGGGFADAQMIDAHMEFATFLEANLERVSFERAHLENTNFTHANLIGARFSWANLYNSLFQGAALFGADLEMVYGISKYFTPNRAQIEDAFGDATTRLPEEVKRPDHWFDRELDIEERRGSLLRGNRPLFH